MSSNSSSINSRIGRRLASDVHYSHVHPSSSDSPAGLNQRPKCFLWFMRVSTTLPLSIRTEIKAKFVSQRDLFQLKHESFSGKHGRHILVCLYPYSWIHERLWSRSGTIDTYMLSAANSNFNSSSTPTVIIIYISNIPTWYRSVCPSAKAQNRTNAHGNKF